MVYCLLKYNNINEIRDIILNNFNDTPLNPIYYPTGTAKMPINTSFPNLFFWLLFGYLVLFIILFVFFRNNRLVFFRLVTMYMLILIVIIILISIGIVFGYIILPPNALNSTNMMAFGLAVFSIYLSLITSKQQENSTKREFDDIKERLNDLDQLIRAGKPPQ